MIQILGKEVSIYESGRVNNDSNWLNDELERGLFSLSCKNMYVRLVFCHIHTDPDIFKGMA
jgi:hypothetical protein